MKGIKVNKSPGIDSIRPKDIKNNADALTPIITKLVNISLDKGEIPLEMKIAVIRPIFKGGAKTALDNYRPISILPIIEKILEEIMSRRLNSFMDKNKIIHSSQYGFQSNKSINKLIGDFSGYINTGLSKNQHSLILFIDFTKAFDTLNHENLLLQLEKIGIRGQALKWFNNYLKERKAEVKINDEMSNMQEFSNGVPQGSKLGPLLYLIYSNRLLRSLDDCKVYA